MPFAQESRHTLHAGCFELGVEDVLLIIAEIKLHRIGAVSLCHFCHFLSLFWVQKNCCKMFDFYNSLFQVLFSFGHNHPQQIVAKAAGKVKVFHGKTEEKNKRGLGTLPYGNSHVQTVGKFGESRLCHDTGSAC